MTTNMIPIDLNESTFMAGYRKLSEENVSRVEAAVKTWMNIPQTAKWFSRSMSLTKNMGEISESGWTRVYRSQIEQLNLPVAAEAIRNWADIYGTISVSMSRNHSNFTGKCMNSAAQFIGTIGKLNGFTDMIPVYSEIMKGMNENMEACVADVSETMNSLNSALEIWMKKNLEAYASADMIKVEKQPVDSKTTKSLS